MLGKRLTVLIVGEDISEYRRTHGTIGVRTDALMVVSISPDKSQISVLSLPRDTVDVPLGNGYTYPQKINDLMYNRGIKALRKAMSALLGVPIDRYIVMDMDDFPWMVDAVGGIDLVVQTHVYDPKLHLDIKPGPLHLDGRLALSFSRTRHYDSDFDRAARQQQVILALVQKWLAPGSSASLVGAMRFLGSLKTNFVISEVPTLLEIGRLSLHAKVARVVLAPPKYTTFSGIDPVSGRGYIIIPNLRTIRSWVRANMTD